MKAVLSLLFLFVSFSASAQVWVNRAVWTDENEKVYSAWIQKNWGKDFFSRTEGPDGLANMFYGLRVDCADNVYSSRLVFSYLHGLPFVMNDPTGGKRFVSNDMTRWNSLPERERIRRFLMYIYDLVSTKSLPHDTYPVRISKETIVPGALIMTVEKNHHSWVIKNIFPTGIPHLVFNSTVGRFSSLVLQERKTWPNGDWVFEGNQTPSGNGGVRYWRKESDLKLPLWQVPGYSEDQYRITAAKWNTILQDVVRTSEETNQQKALRIIDNICADIQQRVDAVNESEAFLKTINYRCMSEEDFDTYSTPSRDRRLADEIIALRSFLKTIVEERNEISLDAKLWVQLNMIFPDLKSSVAMESFNQKSIVTADNSFCRTKYFSRSQTMEKSIDLSEIKRRLFMDRLSSNPNDPPEVRFGEPVMAYENRCPSWGNLKLNYVEP